MLPLSLAAQESILPPKLLEAQLRLLNRSLSPLLPLLGKPTLPKATVSFSHWSLLLPQPPIKQKEKRVFSSCFLHCNIFYCPVPTRTQILRNASFRIPTFYNTEKNMEGRLEKNREEINICGLFI